MRYPENIARLTFGGSLPRDDTWSMSFWIDAGEGDLFDGNPLGPGAGTRGTLADAISGWFRNQDSMISQYARLLWIKANRVGPDGRYVYPYTNEWLVSPTTNGVAGGRPNAQWPHLSLAVTLEAAEARGAATRGRSYPPMTALFPTQEGVIASTDLLAYANNFADLLKNIRAAVPGDTAGTVLVVSNGTKSAPDVGTRRPVIRCRVGNVIDIQQRRRNATPEAYTYATNSPQGPTATVPAPGSETGAG